MTEHPAGASRIFATGASVAATLLLVGAISHDGRADAAAKAHQHAVAMREWNRTQTEANLAQLKWARENPLVVVHTVRRTHYVPIVVPIGGTSTSGTKPNGSPATDGGPAGNASPNTGGGSSGPAPAAPAADPPAAPPAPVEETYGSE